MNLLSADVPTTPPNAFDSLVGIVLLGLVLLMGIFWFLAKMQDLFPSKEEKARIAKFREHQSLITKMTNGDKPESREGFVAHYPNGVTVDGDWTIRTPDGRVIPLPWQAKR